MKATLDGLKMLFQASGALEQDSPLAFSTLVAEANAILLPRDCRDFSRIREIIALLDARATAMLSMTERIRSASSRSLSRGASPASSLGRQPSDSRRQLEQPRRELSLPARNAVEPPGFVSRGQSPSRASRPPSPTRDLAERKRPRTEVPRIYEEEPCPATNANSGAVVRLEDDWPADVRAFYPEIGATNAAVNATSAALNKLAKILFVPDSPPAMEMSAKQFATTELLYPLSPALFPDEEKREWLLDIADGIMHLQGCFLRAAAASKRAFDLYSLATQTQGGSWLAVEQLIYRERYDEQKCLFDSSYRPLTTWSEKVAAALIACEQASALTKDGAPLGPVSPAVTKALQRRHPQGNGGWNYGKSSATPRSGAYDRMSRRPRGKGSQRGTGRAGKAAKPKPSSARQLDAGASQPSGTQP